FELFETMRYQADVGIVRLDAHLARLQKSVLCLGFKFDVDALKLQLENYILDLDSTHTWRLRLALASDGKLTLSHGVLAPLTTPVKLILASTASASKNYLLAHKTTVRQVYDAAWKDAEQQGAFDAIFVNEQGFVTEGGRSNVFAKIKGQWFTPPLAAGVLPGVMRAQVLNDPSYFAQEKNLSLDELLTAEELFVCNSLRGILPATIQAKEDV
ncbi:MAG: aminotransferase class IV, partial [Candidatus Obscuribacterales bacterium]|nr:aminotransferase class IV [Candidatus Obscuribacterales bacterium]